ncbi:hypothetical protein R1flu_022680 [Riccia fluitans]|uniref:Uncharacterized protein n=1 Tax=Riccia fluitans TaxID=41844 RepID=A0ABD1XPW2_9MARC
MVARPASARPPMALRPTRLFSEENGVNTHVILFLRLASSLSNEFSIDRAATIDSTFSEDVSPLLRDIPRSGYQPPGLPSEALGSRGRVGLMASGLAFTGALLRSSATAVDGGEGVWANSSLGNDSDQSLIPTPRKEWGGCVRSVRGIPGIDGNPDGSSNSEFLMIVFPPICHRWVRGFSSFVCKFLVASLGLPATLDFLLMRGCIRSRPADGRRFGFLMVLSFPACYFSCVFVVLLFPEFSPVVILRGLCSASHPTLIRARRGSALIRTPSDVRDPPSEDSHSVSFEGPLGFVTDLSLLCPVSIGSFASDSPSVSFIMIPPSLHSVTS